MIYLKSCLNYIWPRISITFTYTLIAKIGLESANIEIWPRKYNPLYLVVMKVASVLNFHLQVIYAFYSLKKALFLVKNDEKPTSSDQT